MGAAESHKYFVVEKDGQNRGKVVYRKDDVQPLPRGDWRGFGIYGLVDNQNPCGESTYIGIDKTDLRIAKRRERMQAAFGKKN